MHKKRRAKNAVSMPAASARKLEAVNAAAQRRDKTAYGWRGVGGRTLANKQTKYKQWADAPPTDKLTAAKQYSRRAVKQRS